MERRVAKVLSGQRTPGSGAMARYKGDVTIKFQNYPSPEHPSKYIIECKLSDGHNRNGALMPIELKWFAKIQQEAQAMNAKFGILVIHYHGYKEDYVFVRSDHFDWIYTKSPRADIVDAIIAARIEAYDIMRFADGKLRTIYGLERHKIENIFFREIMGFNIGAVNTPDGTYYILELKQFRDLMEGI